MSIVLREHEWAENAIQSRAVGKKPSETLRRVARYYMDKGYGKRETRSLLDSFLLQCNPNISLPKWSNSIDYAIKRALKCQTVFVECIDITAPEMEKIQALGGKQIQRLAFTLLCLAKYRQIANADSDHWVSDKESEIMSLSNINTSIKRQSMMYWTLREAGMIQFSRKVDNTSVRVLFVENGDIVMSVMDFRNLGYQYLKYCGEPYFECQHCGITAKIENPAKGMKQKHCKACAAEVAVQQRINSVMRQRKKAGRSNENC